MGCSFLLLLFPATLPGFFATITIFTMGEMFAFSRQSAYAASLAPDDMRGRYTGFLSLAWSLGGIVSSVAALEIYEHSPAAVWIITSCFGLCVAALLSAGGRQPASAAATDAAAGDGAGSA
jgi:MFS family permease